MDLSFKYHFLFKNQHDNNSSLLLLLQKLSNANYVFHFTLTVFFFFFLKLPITPLFRCTHSKCNASMLKCARSKVSFRARISFWKLIIRHNWGQNGVVAGVELLLLGDFLDYLVHFSSYLKLQKDFIYLIPIFQIGNTSDYTKKSISIGNSLHPQTFQKNGISRMRRSKFSLRCHYCNQATKKNCMYKNVWLK